MHVTISVLSILGAVVAALDLSSVVVVVRSVYVVDVVDVVYHVEL